MPRCSMRKERERGREVSEALLQASKLSVLEWMYIVETQPCPYHTPAPITHTHTHNLPLSHTCPCRTLVKCGENPASTRLSSPQVTTHKRDSCLGRITPLQCGGRPCVACLLGYAA